MSWRRAWARDWDNVRWCSTACRRRGVRPEDLAIEQALMASLETVGATVDPMTVEFVGGSVRTERPEVRREAVRRAVRRLAARGEVEVLQRGRPVDPSTARGPIQMRRVRGVGNEGS